MDWWRAALIGVGVAVIVLLLDAVDEAWQEALTAGFGVFVGLLFWRVNGRRS